MFDGYPEQSQDTIALYLDRRQRAATLWRNVPVEVFDMTVWNCGSVSCALGWLGQEKFDGWKISEANNSAPIAPNGFDGYLGAAEYFGLTVAQAIACFGGQRPTARFHCRWFAKRITPTDVATKLLAMPIITLQDRKAIGYISD